MMFKLGDLVLCNDLDHYGVENVIGKVTEINCERDKDYYGVEVKGYPEHQKNMAFWERELVLLPLNNSLNKKLYPDRVLWQNYLVPRDLAEKLIEETSHRKEQDDKN